MTSEKIEVRLDSYQDSRPEEVITILDHTPNQKAKISMSVEQARTLKMLLDKVIEAKQAPVSYAFNEFGFLIKL